MNNKRKYPLKLFIFGVISNLIRKFYVGALILIFLLIGIINNNFIKIAGILFSVWLLYAIIEQLILRRVALKNSSNEQYNQIMDMILGENGPFSKSDNKVDIITIVNDIIKNDDTNSNDDD